MKITMNLPEETVLRLDNLSNELRIGSRGRCIEYILHKELPRIITERETLWKLLIQLSEREIQSRHGVEQ